VKGPENEAAILKTHRLEKIKGKMPDIFDENTDFEEEKSHEVVYKYPAIRI
jgi:hypothetical protein